jgi:hypothetical protein
MSTVLLIVGTWAALIVAFLGVLGIAGARRCRRGEHEWCWDEGRWVSRCGNQDMRAPR